MIEYVNKFIDRLLSRNKPIVHGPSDKLTLDEFMKRFSLHFNSMVSTCTNTEQLEAAERYIKNAMTNFLLEPNSPTALEYFRILIIPKHMEISEVDEANEID